MTDRPATPADDDAVVELASRYVDGDLDAVERAAAEADPEVMAWVERFGGVRAALQAPVQVDATRRDAAITAALAAFTTTAGDSDDAGATIRAEHDQADDDVDDPAERVTAPVVSDLAAARARRAGRMGRWLGVAAAVAVLAIGGAVIAGNRGDDGRDAADDVAMNRSTLDADSAEKATTADDTATMSAAAPGVAPHNEQSYDPSAADQAAATTVASAETTAAGGADSTTAGSNDATALATDAPSGGAEPPAEGGSPPGQPESATTDGARYSEPGDLQALVDAEAITTADGAAAPCASVATGDLVAVDATYGERAVVVYRDEAAQALTAYAADTCQVLAAYPYDAG